MPRAAFLEAVEVLLDQVIPSERQSAEWGVRAIKAPFKRLCAKLPGDAYKRFRILALSAHLYNLRTHTVGLNQIRTVYAAGSDVVQPWVLELANENV